MVDVAYVHLYDVFFGIKSSAVDLRGFHLAVSDLPRAFASNCVGLRGFFPFLRSLNDEPRFKNCRFYKCRAGSFLDRRLGPGQAFVAPD
jgi:hypothetical protein